MNQTLKTGTFDMLLSNQLHIHENIEFADQKAGFFVTLNGALMALIYPLIKPANHALTICGFEVCYVLAVGIALGIWVIWPRGEQNRSRGTGVVDADRINQFSSVWDFINRCATISDDVLLDEARAFIFDRSQINRKKYLWLRRSIQLSFFGWLGALLFAGWMKLHPAL